MLGIHSHTDNVHTKLEIVCNFLVLFSAQLAFKLYELQPKLPSIADIYYSVLYSFVVTFGFYGINKLRANSNNDSKEPSP